MFRPTLSSGELYYSIAIYDMSSVITTAAYDKDGSISPDSNAKSDVHQTEPENAENSKPEGDNPESVKSTQLAADKDSASSKIDSEEEGKNTSTPKTIKGKYLSHPLRSERVF
jgi:hypothetical protein